MAASVHFGLQHLCNGETVTRDGAIEGANDMRLGAQVVGEEARQVLLWFFTDAQPEAKKVVVVGVTCISRAGA